MTLDNNDDDAHNVQALDRTGLNQRLDSSALVQDINGKPTASGMQLTNSQLLGSTGEPGRRERRTQVEQRHATHELEGVYIGPFVLAHSRPSK